MDQENPKRVDLLGDPWTEQRDPRGRKSHRRTVQIAEKVAVLRAGGKSEATIARRLGLSEPTLRKYYFRELANGADLARALVHERLWELGMAGNVSALKALEAIFANGEAAVPVARRGPKEEPLGKKAAAELDAQHAHEGTSWGDLLN